MQIRQIEEELGTQLFERTTRSVELTEAGRTLYAHAVPILASVSAAWEQTARTGAGEIGRLAVCYTPTVADEALPLIVEELHARYPAVRLRTCEMWMAESVEAVTTGRFDVGLARCPVGLGDDLECASIREEPIGVVLGAGHPLAREDTVAVEALGWETLCIWPRELSPGFYDHVARRAARARVHGAGARVREPRARGADERRGRACRRRGVPRVLGRVRDAVRPAAGGVRLARARPRAAACRCTCSGSARATPPRSTSRGWRSTSPSAPAGSAPPWPRRTPPPGTTRRSRARP